MTHSATILVVDDEEDIGEFVCTIAGNLGLKCVAATDASSLSELLTPEVSLILLDLMMPEMDGVEALRLLGELHCKAGIVLMSGISTRVLETAEKLANTLGLIVVGRLAKPFQVAQLEQLLKDHQMPRAAILGKPTAGVPIPDRDMHYAVRRNEFVLHYQPQIDVATHAVIGVEALVRWQHPVRGLIFPDSFIGRMEELNLIDELGWLVAERALVEVKQFAAEGRVLPRLALNASVHSLRDLKFPDRFSALLKEHEMPVEGVILEITESGLLNELSRTLDVLTRLRVKGVKLSIDDFGTGYAMMQQLINIPATELKIDRLFVMSMHVNSSDRIMVEKSIEIGHALGMAVVAEGVETQQQLEFLREGGCDSVQGYLFTRPLPPKEFVSWMTAQRSIPDSIGSLTEPGRAPTIPTRN
jgi:EAL domain-containing protein (putative c-di-GMP-specific phosphodiesterase class I)/ActR/RegA family two-component response regulator